MRNIVMAVCVFSIAGCATTVSQKAAGIQVQHQDSALLKDCKKLGPINVSASSAWGIPKVYDDAEIIAREKVADMGGDSLVITNYDLVDYGTAMVHGVAFNCYGNSPKQ